MDWIAIDELAAKLMKNRKAHKERERGFVYYHGKRVGSSAIELRKLVLPQDGSGDDMLRLAGMFHDVGKGLSPHARFGAPIFIEAMKGYVDDEALVLKCAEIISHHGDRQPEESPYDIWTQLIQDADLLDHSGSYGVWMNAQFYSYFEGCMSDGAKYHSETSEQYYQDNVGLLNFEISRKIFRDKINAEQAFFKRAAIEAEGFFVGISKE